MIIFRISVQFDTINCVHVIAQCSSFSLKPTQMSGMVCPGSQFEVMTDSWCAFRKCFPGVFREWDLAESVRLLTMSATCPWLKRGKTIINSVKELGLFHQFLLGSHDTCPAFHASFDVTMSG